MKRQKKSPMFVSTIPTNYDFIDYTIKDAKESQNASGQFGSLNHAQGSAGQEKSNMKSIFDQVITETKEQDVDVEEENVHKQGNVNGSGNKNINFEVKKSPSLNANGDGSGLVGLSNKYSSNASSSDRNYQSITQSQGNYNASFTQKQFTHQGQQQVQITQNNSTSIQSPHSQKIQPQPQHHVRGNPIQNQGAPQMNFQSQPQGMGRPQQQQQQPEWVNSPNKIQRPMGNNYGVSQTPKGQYGNNTNQFGNQFVPQYPGTPSRNNLQMNSPFREEKPVQAETPNKTQQRVNIRSSDQGIPQSPMYKQQQQPPVYAQSPLNSQTSGGYKSQKYETEITSSFKSNNEIQKSTNSGLKAKPSVSGSSDMGYSDPKLLQFLPESVRANIEAMIRRSKNS